MRRVLGLAIVIGCAATPKTFPPTKFVNAPVPTVVNDRLDVPIKPKEIPTYDDLDAFDSSVQRPVTRSAELIRNRRALGVNALGDVPDSTWFTNRRGLTVEQMRSGPVTVDNPELHTPWTIKSTKPGGTTLGYIVKDARGFKYLVKFDSLGSPELETGTDVVVDRLLWAAGYNTPENEIAYIRPSDLVLGPDAVVNDELGQPLGAFKRPKLEHDLLRIEHEPDGRIRCMTSRWLEGKPLGGPPREGVRADDPNDRIPHELRRDLRGMYTIEAWLDMVDDTTGNVLDMWVADAADPARHYVMHYALDFGMSLGAMATISKDLRRGYTYRFDWGGAATSLITVGLNSRDWQDRGRAPPIRGVATLFTASTFDPGKWYPDLPYVPFKVSDRFDQYWGAKIVTAFTRAQIHAAVEAARFSDPRATEYITNTLVERQHRIAQYWFSRVAPIDRVEIDPSEGLCFEDLGIESGVANAAATTYSIAATDARGHSIGVGVAATGTTTGRACTLMPPLADDRDGYTIVTISILRPNTQGTTYVHLARDPTSGQPRVIGLWRD